MRVIGIRARHLQFLNMLHVHFSCPHVSFIVFAKTWVVIRVCSVWRAVDSVIEGIVVVSVGAGDGVAVAVAAATTVVDVAIVVVDWAGDAESSCWWWRCCS